MKNDQPVGSPIGILFGMFARLSIKGGASLIFCLALACSLPAYAQPVFYSASVDNASLGNRIPLVLIHGIESDPSMWNNFLQYYATHPTLQNAFKPYLFGYRTDDKIMTPADPNDIFGLSQILGKNIEQTFGTKSVVILAHSMGGLLARAEMEYYSYSDKVRGGDRTLLLLTLATPHHGTPAANDYLASYPAIPWFTIDNYSLHAGFAYNLEWDNYDGNLITEPPFSPIPSSQDYSKIVVYGGAISSNFSIPIQDYPKLDPPFDLISGFYGYNNDGVVPIGSALFRKSNSLSSEDGIKVRQVDGSCDHFEIYSGQKTVNGGTPIFDSLATDLESAIPITAPLMPTISSVSPPAFTGLPIGQMKLIRVIGSGFTASSTLTFNDGVNPSYTGGVPTSWSANELDYNVSTGTNQANWTVQVINGAQTSNLGHFIVNAPTTPSAVVGSLVVNLSPAGAISAGAQWQVDETGYNSSGQVVGYLTPGSHTVSFKPISGYTTPANQTVTISANSQTPASGTYYFVLPSTYTLTLNQGGSTGSIAPSPSGSWNGSAYVYNSGSVVQLTANANPGYHFVNWSGDVTGSANPVILTVNGNKNVTANFAPGDPNMGTISVTVQPPAAAAAGVTWGFNANDVRASGSSFTGYPESVWLMLHPVDGWLGSPMLLATIAAGQTTNYTVTFTQDTTPGLLTVTISPPDAVNAGAYWHVNGGTYGNGASASLAPGSYNVTFDQIGGWSAPTSQSVTVQRALTTVVSGVYTPPAGQPAIGNVSPAIAPMTGGTLLTISGANFTAPTSVMVGGESASNVSVVSSTQITCIAPPNTNYGTANIVVQTATGSCTNLNGFSYGLPNGNKIDLLGSIGGSCYAVTSQGSFAYAGEGHKIVVLDVSSPSAPSKVGEVALPGTVRAIALFGHYAYIAAQDAGVQVIDVSNPTAPTICGVFKTETNGWTDGITIFGGMAYVANAQHGLQILDLGSPTVPTLLSSTNVGGGESVAVKPSGTGIFAYVSTPGTLCVIDVSNPQAPLLRGQTSINGGSCYSVAVSGNYILAASSSGNLEIIDVSNPDAPADTGHAPGVFFASSVAVGGNGYVYACSSISGKGFYIFSLSGGILTQIGNLQNLAPDGYCLSVSGNNAYLPSRSSGVQIINVANPNSPSLLTTFSEAGVFRQYNSVAVTQNSMAACGYPQGTITGFNTIFDVSNPSNPMLTATPNTGGTRILANNGLAYVLSPNSNLICNISSPASPQVLKLFSNTAFPGEDIALNGNSLYAVGLSAANQPHLAIFDVSTPSAPQLKGTKDFSEFSSGIATSVTAVGNKVLVGVQTFTDPIVCEVICLDVSNPTSPVEVGAFTNILTDPISVKISSDGDFGYVVTGGNPSTLIVLDIGQASNPILVTNVPVDGVGVTGMDLRGNEVFVTTYLGIYVFDISTKTSPALTRSYSLAQAQGVCAPSDSVSQSKNIYVADMDGGLVVLREQDIELPTVFITNPTFSPVYTNATSAVNLGGSSSDNVGVTSMTWANNRGGSGQINPPFDNWYVGGILLYPGSNSLSVTAYDASGNGASDTLMVIHNSTNQNQTITFSAIPDHTFGDPPIQLVAAASSGLPINFSVISGPAVVTSSNTLVITGAGAVTVEANQAGNGSFNPATPVDQIFNLARANQSIAFAPIPSKSASDAPFTLSATTSSGLPAYVNVISGPAILDTNNSVTLLGAGAVTAIAWQPGNSNYNAATSVQQSFTVSKVPQAITFGPLNQQKFGDAPFSLNAIASSGLPVNYSVSGSAILNGHILTLTGYGTLQITASQPGNGAYAPALDVMQMFTVVPPDNTFTGGQRMSDGSFRLAFYGLTGSNYSFQVSTDLLSWQQLTNILLTNSPFYLTDPTATNFSLRFYKAMLP